MNRWIGLLAELDEPALAVARAALADALRAAGDELVDGANPDLRVTAVLDLSLDEQGYEIAPAATEGAADIRILGGGRTGLLYGILRVAEISREVGIDRVGPEAAHPDIRRRGIKFNLPLDARTPGYTDDGDAAQANVPVVWDLDFWRDLFDRMVGERYNMISLWNLHPFPSMVKVPEFENVALADVQRGTVLPRAHTTGIGMFNDRVAASAETVRRMTIEDKILFWRAVMQLAHDRCIEVMIFTWNVYSYGTEGSGYGIDDTLDSEVTKRYFRASVRALLTTYPLLSGIGVTAGEHMDRHTDGPVNQRWLRETYGAAIGDVQSIQPGRSIRLIHRTHWAEMSDIVDLFDDVDVPHEFSYKYSSAHLHALARPHYIDQDGFLDALPEGARFWLTVRDDDFYLLRPGDPEFVREYLARIPDKDKMNGFYLGPDGYILGREFLTPDTDGIADEHRQLVLDRQWYQFAAFGRLAYDPTLDERYFIARLAQRYPGVDASTLYRVWRDATTIIPLVNRFHFGGNKYDLDWYPEACVSHPRQRTGFHTVHDFIRCAPMPTSGMVSIPDAHIGIDHGTSPHEVARVLAETAESVATTVRSLEIEAGGELESVLCDLLSLTHLGRYYSEKILGAIAVHALTVSPPGAGQARAGAVGHLTRAAGHWSDYADSVHARYRPQRLSRLGGTLVDLHALQADVEYDITLASSAGYDEHHAAQPTLPR